MLDFEDVELDREELLERCRVDGDWLDDERLLVERPDSKPLPEREEVPRREELLPSRDELLEVDRCLLDGVDDERLLVDDRPDSRPLPERDELPRRDELFPRRDELLELERCLLDCVDEERLLEDRFPDNMFRLLRDDREADDGGGVLVLRVEGKAELLRCVRPLVVGGGLDRRPDSVELDVFRLDAAGTDDFRFAELPRAVDGARD